MTNRITTTEVRSRLAELLGRVEYARESFTVTRNGRAIAVLCPATERTSQKSVRELLYEQLVRDYGEPTDETAYVHRWFISPQLHVVAEKRGQRGKLWAPWFGQAGLPSCAEEISPPRRVNSNVYSRSPVLAAGHLTQFEIANPADIDAVVNWMRLVETKGKTTKGR